MSTQRILIVDDDPAVLLTLAASIEKINPAYCVDTCENGAEALTYLADHQYILMLTDYSMPGMSGIELAQAARERSPETRIIMMTAYGSDALHEQADALHLDEFVDKPFTVKQIREIITHIIGNATDAPRVLIIEDNTDLRRLYSRALTRAGYSVKSASTIQEANSLLEQSRFDVMLCDIHIGDERGTDLVREQQAKLQENRTHVVMITGETWYSDIAEEVGADFLLEKPVGLDTLVGLVERLTAAYNL